MLKNWIYSITWSKNYIDERKLLSKIISYYIITDTTLKWNSLPVIALKLVKSTR